MGLLDDLLRGATGMGGGYRRPPASVGGNSGMGRILIALLPVVLSMLARRRQQQQAGRRPDLGPGHPTDLGPGTGAGAGGLGLDDILGGALGGGPLRGSTSPRTGGILGDLLRRFEQAGFGRQAQSWVAVGPNDPIPQTAVEQVLGPDAVGEIARRSGLSEQETTQGLAQLLPELVDHVTPAGEVPDEDSLTRSVEELIERSGLPGGGGANGS